MNNIKTILLTIFNAPADFIFKKIESIISFVSEEPDYTQYYTNLGMYDLVVVEYKGLKIIAQSQDYYLTEINKIKACYFANSFSARPVLLTNENVKNILGDVRLFTHQHENELLQISQELKTTCILTLINILFSAKETNTPLKKKYLKTLKNEYRHKINVLSSAFI